MAGVDDGSLVGSDPSLPTPGVGKNEEKLDPKSEVGFPGSLDKVAPQRTILSVQGQTHAGQHESCTDQAVEEETSPVQAVEETNDGLPESCTDQAVEEETSPVQEAMCTVNAEEEVPIPDGEESTVNAEEEVPIPDGEECTVDHVDEEANPDEEAPSLDPVQVETNPDQLESGLARWKPLSMERTDYVSEPQGRLPSALAVYLALLDSRDEGRALHLQTMEEMKRMEKRMENKQEERHNELVGMFRVQKEENQLLQSDNIRLKQDRDAEKFEKERLQVKEVRLKEERDTALESTKKLNQEREAKKRECEELQEQLRQVGTERNEACKRLKQDAEKRENELQELMAQQTNELQESTNAQNRLKDEKEDQLEQMTRIRKERDGLLIVNTWLKQDAEKRENELQELVKAWKPFLPDNQDKYDLEPFTGYAIVVSNAVFKEDVVRGQSTADDAMAYATLSALMMAKALFAYGFEVKPMKNLTSAELKDALEECDKRWQQDKLVLIFIITHGSSAVLRMAKGTKSSQREVAKAFANRMRNGKPTIMFVAACRLPADGKLDVQDETQSHIFVGNASRLGFETSLSDVNKFVGGLLPIFHNDKSRCFLREINCLASERYTKLDPDSYLRKNLLLPAYDAQKRTDDERLEAYKYLKEKLESVQTCSVM